MFPKESREPRAGTVRNQSFYLTRSCPRCPVWWRWPPSCPAVRPPSPRLHSPRPATAGHHSCSTHWSVGQRGDKESVDDNGGHGHTDQQALLIFPAPHLSSHCSNQNLPSNGHFKNTSPFTVAALKEARFPTGNISSSMKQRRSPDSEIKSLLLSWEDEVAYLKDLEASLHISLFLAKLNRWLLRTPAFDLLYSSLGPQCYGIKLANGSRLPESLYTHTRFSACFYRHSLWPAYWALRFEPHTGFKLLSRLPIQQNISPDTKLLPEQASKHQRALSKASTTVNPQLRQSTYANHSNSKAFVCTKTSFSSYKGKRGSLYKRKWALSTRLESFKWEMAATSHRRFWSRGENKVSE